MKPRNFVIGVMLFACVLGGGIVLSCDDSDSGGKGPSKLVLFGTDTSYTGNLGGRAGADTKCAADVNRPAGLTHIRAFISVTADDCIANMPDNYNFPDNVPIVAPDEVTVIADNWADLLDGSIDVSLYLANMLPASKSGYWWSGSTSNGTLSADNCNAWSNADGSYSGMVGNPSFTNTAWLEETGLPSTMSFYLVGLAY
jgi:hypothetical protein